MIADPTTRPALAERLMKPREVAAIYAVEPETVAEWARTGRLASVRTPGGHYRVKGADVEALIASETTTP